MPPRSMRTPFCENCTVCFWGSSSTCRKSTAGSALSICCFVRMDMLAEVVQIADAGVGDVEGAVGDDRVFLGGDQQIEQLLADVHRAVRRLGIDLGDFAASACRCSSIRRCGAFPSSTASMACSALSLSSDHSSTVIRVPMMPSVTRRTHSACTGAAAQQKQGRAARGYRALFSKCALMGVPFTCGRACAAIA